MGAGMRRARTAARASRGRFQTVTDLADELFSAVQLDQGNGFISDGLAVLPTQARLFEIVRGHL